MLAALAASCGASSASRSAHAAGIVDRAVAEQRIAGARSTLEGSLPAAPAAGPAVGRVPHELDVAADGALVASIPFTAPPGAGGLTPALELGYDSTGGAAQAGQGWSLGGLLTVSRCSKSIAEHLVTGGIELESTDALCLNGAALRRFKSTSQGDDEYRFPEDPGVRVIGRGAFPNHSRFEVLLPDGTRVVLGDTAASRLEAGGSGDVLVWAESRREDASSNYWIVEYVSHAGIELLPAALHYAGNVAAGRDARAQNRIELSWELRPDRPIAFLAGVQVGRTQRLAEVRTFADGALAHRWQLGYRQASFSGRSVLTSVRLGDASGIELPPLELVYDESAPLAAGRIDDSATAWPGRFTIAPASTEGVLADWSALSRGALQTALGQASGMLTMAMAFKLVDQTTDAGSELPTDFDGDGRTDLAFTLRGYDYGVVPLPLDHPGAHYLWQRVAYSDGAGGFSSISDLGDRIWAPEKEGTILAPIHWQYPVIPGDYDGNGKTDLLVARVGDGPGATHYRVTFDDGQANGSPDYSYPNGLANWWGAHPYLEHGPFDDNEHKTMLPGDFDGDGRTDVVVLTEDPGAPATGLARIFLSQGRRYHVLQWASDNPVGRWVPPPASAPCNFLQYGYQCDPDPPRVLYFVGDWDGDGRSDLAVRNQDAGSPATLSLHRSVQLTPGHVTLQHVGTVTLDSVDDGYQQLIVQDLNQDGLTDVAELFPVGSQMKMTSWLSTGRGLVRAHHQSLWAWDRDHARRARYRDVIAAFTGAGPSLVHLHATDVGQWSAEHWAPSPGTAGYARIDDRTYMASSILANDLHEAFVPADLDGNGVDEIVAVRNIPGPLNQSAFQQHTDLTIQASDLRAPAATDRLIEIRDGAGVTLAVEYASIGRADVELALTPPPSAAAYPVVDVKGTLPVVRSLTTTTSTQLWPREVRFAYAGAKVDRHRGSLGFAGRMRWETGKEISRIEHFRQDFPFTGRIWRSELRRGGNQVIAEEDTSWSSRDVPVAHASFTSTVKLVHPSIVESRTYDVDHPVAGSPLTAARLEVVVDDYGMPLRSEAVAWDASGLNVTATSDARFQHDEARWILGLPLETSSSAVNAEGAVPVHRTEIVYDAQSRVSRVIQQPDDPSKRTELSIDARDAFGHETVTTLRGSDFPARTETLTFEPGGRFVSSRVDAAGHVIWLSHDPRFGTITGVVDPNQVASSITFDGFGRFVAQWHPATGTTSALRSWTDGVTVPGSRWQIETSMTGLPRMVSVHDPIGRPLRTELRAAGEPARVQTYAYDGGGRLVAFTRPHFEGTAGYGARIVYDTLDRIRQAIVDDGTNAGRAWTLDYAGLSRTVMDPLGGVSIERRDGTGDLVETIDALGGRTHWSRDAIGRTLRLVDAAGNQASWAYDAGGNLIHETDPSLGTSTMAYDGLGQLIRRTDATGQMVRHRYDVVGRLIERIGVEGLTEITWDQTHIGEPTQICGPIPAVVIGGEPTYAPCGGGDARTRFTYDALGRVSRVDERIAQVDYASQYTYDASSRVATFEPPRASGDPLVVSYHYGALGDVDAEWLLDGPLPAQPMLLAQVLGRDADGVVSSVQLGNGQIWRATRSPALGTLSALQVGTAGDPGSVVDLVHSRDALGRVIEEMDRRVAGSVTAGGGESGAPATEQSYLRRRFSYDAIGRVVTEEVLPPVGSSVSRTFQYDTVGNLLQKDGRAYAYGGPTGGPFAVTARTNPFEQLVYDAKGRLVSGTTTSVGWTSFDRPSRITRGNARVDFQYDGLGREMARQTYAGATLTSARAIVAGGLERLARPGMPIEERWHLGSLVPVQYVRRSDGARWHDFTIPDGRGSLHTMIADNGIAVAQGRHDAWGEPVPAWDQLGQPWNNGLTGQFTQGYTGHDMLDEVAVIDMGGRVYDPDLARVLSPDPHLVGASGSPLNRYAYVGNDPINRTDPTGFLPCPPDCGPFDWFALMAEGRQGGTLPVVEITESRSAVASSVGQPVPIALAATALWGATSGKWPSLTRVAPKIVVTSPAPFRPNVRAAVSWRPFSKGALRDAIGQPGQKVKNAFLNYLKMGGKHWGLFGINVAAKTYAKVGEAALERAILYEMTGPEIRAAVNGGAFSAEDYWDQHVMDVVTSDDRKWRDRASANGRARERVYERLADDELADRLHSKYPKAVREAAGSAADAASVRGPLKAPGPAPVSGGKVALQAAGKVAGKAFAVVDFVGMLTGTLGTNDMLHWEDTPAGQTAALEGERHRAWLMRNLQNARLDSVWHYHQQFLRSLPPVVR